MRRVWKTFPWRQTEAALSDAIQLIGKHPNMSHVGRIVSVPFVGTNCTCIVFILKHFMLVSTVIVHNQIFSAL